VQWKSRGTHEDENTVRIALPTPHLTLVVLVGLGQVHRPELVLGIRKRFSYESKDENDIKKWICGCAPDVEDAVEAVLVSLLN
jgi:hypothetical protein